MVARHRWSSGQNSVSSRPLAKLAGAVCSRQHGAFRALVLLPLTLPADQEGKVVVRMLL